jgi:hypothetical protein
MLTWVSALHAGTTTSRNIWQVDQTCGVAKQPNTEKPLRDPARYDKHVGFGF